MEDIIFRLQKGKYNDYKWVRRESHIRQAGRGRLEIRDEWESRYPWEINEKVFSDHEGS